MRRAVLVLVAALVLTLTPAVPGTSTPQVEAAPNDVVGLVVEGIGYGHGRGMSQWGAYGWAVDQSKSWTWILDHYYGGTTLGDVNTAQTRIKVRLLDFNGASTVGVTTGAGDVTAAGITARSLYATETSNNSFAVYSSAAMACPGGTTLTVPDGTIQRGSSNGTAVRQIQAFLNAYQSGTPLAVDGDFGPLTEARLKEWQTGRGIAADGVWHTSPDATTARAQISASAGSAAWTYRGTFAGPLTFTTPNGENSAASASSVLGICEGSALTHYRGSLQFHNGPGNVNAVVNDVKTEDYLRGVVPREISASWADAGGGNGANAVRAQAVAARSYALAYTSSSWSPAQICDTQSCQVYFGSATRGTAAGSATNIEDPRTDAAIVATNGKVRKWSNGAVVSTEFSASNGPRTAGFTFPAVDDAAGDGTANNPNHQWTRVLPAATVAANYGLGTLLSAEMVEGDTRYDGIWWNQVRLVGTSRTVTVSAWDFMSKYRSTFGGLMSPGFTVRTVTRDTTTKTLGFIGDSVGASVAASPLDELSILTNGMFTTSRWDTVSGRCTVNTACAGTSGVEAAAQLPMNLDLAVVQLGYNDWSPDMASAIDQMMTALRARNVKQVAWVNLATAPGHATYSPVYAQRNAALEAATARWPNLTVLDWDAASTHAESGRWFSDHAHLTTTGQAEFAVWLRAEILAAAGGTSGTWSVPTRLAPPKRLQIPVVGTELRDPSGAEVVVPETAAAVTLNVTSVKASNEGYLTVWPCKTTRPVASSVNYAAGAITGNGVIAPVDADGTVCVYAYSSTDVVVDIAGWFDGAAADQQFIAATPSRIVDTRYGIGAPKRRVTADTPLSITVTGAALTSPAGSALTVPANAEAVAVNITAVKPVHDGYVTLWPCGQSRPVVSSLNYSGGAVVANGAIVDVGAGGKICLHSYAPSDVVVDIVGWFGASPNGVGSGMVSNVPERIVDTRIGLGAAKRQVTPTSDLTVPIAGRSFTVGTQRLTVPAGVEAVALNVTAVGSLTSGYATVWPCGTARPTASSLNYERGVTTAGNVIAPVGSNGAVCLHTYTNAHYVVDVFGWFTGTDQYVGTVPGRVIDTRIGLGPAPR